jgi:hypothetical protein
MFASVVSLVKGRRPGLSSERSYRLAACSGAVQTGLARRSVAIAGKILSAATGDLDLAAARFGNQAARQQFRRDGLRQLRHLLTDADVVQTPQRFDRFGTQ